MANKDYIPKRNIRLFDQMMTLRAAYPSASCELRNGTLFWFGKMKPTPLSREYNVVLTYSESQAPKVWVIGEELQRIDDPDFPHKYDVDPENGVGGEAGQMAAEFVQCLSAHCQNRILMPSHFLTGVS